MTSPSFQRRSVRPLILLAALSVAAPAAAEVVEQSDTHFVIEQSRTVAMTAPVLWERLIAPGLWWDDAHSWSGDTANMRLDLVPGGCWCEALVDGGVVEHGRIIALYPGRGLIMRADLGPLLTAAVAAKMEWAIAPQDGPSGGDAALVTVTFRYSVSGHLPAPGAVLAPGVDAVLAQQIDGLVSPGNPQ